MAITRHLQLTANTATPVTLPRSPLTVEVVNVDGAAAVYFTVDGSTPTVGGDNTEVVPAGVGGLEVDMPYGLKVVRLISTGTPRISVVGR